MEMAILNVFYLILLIALLVRLIEKVKSTSIKAFFKTNEPYMFLILCTIGIVPIFVMGVGVIANKSPSEISANTQLNISTFMAFLISFVWLLYVRKIDIYEKERWGHIIVTFIMGAFFSYFAPIGYGIFSAFGVDLNNRPINDFLYSIFIIGGIEETVKITPFLILLKYTKAADEPYDYILYPSIAALGFAFVENISYINSSGLFNIGGRALYSTVAHMVFSSVIGYGMLLSKFGITKRSKRLSFLFAFAIAAAMHGFYDYWLINDFVSSFSFITTLFFLATIHIWFVLKNNAINMSNYYDPKTTLDNGGLKWYLIMSLSAVLMIGYLIVSYVYGMEWGNQYLVQSWVAYGYIILYFSLSFSRYKIKHGRLSKIKVPLDFFIPKPIKRD